MNVRSTVLTRLMRLFDVRQAIIARRTYLQLYMALLVHDVQPLAEMHRSKARSIGGAHKKGRVRKPPNFGLGQLDSESASRSKDDPTLSHPQLRVSTHVTMQPSSLCRELSKPGVVFVESRGVA